MSVKGVEDERAAEELEGVERTGVDVFNGAFWVGESAFHVWVWGCVGVWVDGLPDGEESVHVAVVEKLVMLVVTFPS